MTRDEHLMVIGMEECNEIAQRLSKALRFGLTQVQQDPDDKPEENPQRLNNALRIRLEFLELAAILDMLGIDADLDDNIMALKVARVEKYLERSRREGTLQE